MQSIEIQVVVVVGTNGHDVEVVGLTVLVVGHIEVVFATVVVIGGGGT